MRTSETIQKKISKIAVNNRFNLLGSRTLAIVPVLVLVILTIGSIQETLGKISKSFIISDSALTAKFNVTFTLPKEFYTEQGVASFEYSFLSQEDIIILDFHVHNDGDVDVLCTPHIDTDILYKVFINRVEHEEFVVKAKESVEFHVLLGPNGLTTDITDADFFIDIKQIDGGWEE